MSANPNYAALVKLLPTLNRLPDAIGETVLTPEEAAKIRAIGFTAEAGHWKAPPLPPEFVRDNPLLEPLSVGWHDPPIAALRPSEPVCTERVIKAIQGSGEIAPSKKPPESRGCHPDELKRQVPQAFGPADEALVRKVVAEMRDRASRLTRPMPKRRWQQLYWRYPARIFNAGFQIIVRERRIFLEIK